MRRLAISVNENLRHVLAVEREYLHALSAAIGDIDQAVIRDAHRVDRSDELIRSRPGDFHRRDALALGDLRRIRHVIEWLVAKRAPHPLEGTGIRIEDDNPSVAVAVGDEQFVGWRMYERVGGLPHVLSVLVALALAFAANLHNEFSVLRELDEVMIGWTIATEPYEPLRISVDSVFSFGPVVARAGTAPASDEVSVLVEHQHRWRRHAFLIGAHSARALQDPRMALLVDRDAGNLTPDPLGRQLRPRRLHLKRGYLARLRSERLGGCRPC